MQEWVSTLRNAIKAWQTKRATLATSKNDAAYAITEAPVWIPDDEVRVLLAAKAHMCGCMWSWCGVCVARV